jgi:Fe-S-cluster containining protein
VVFGAEMREELAGMVDGDSRYAILPCPSGGIMLAMHGTGTACPFLSSERCSIWERRPAACVDLPQAYIGKMSEEQLQERAKICPGMKGFLDGR